MQPLIQVYAAIMIHPRALLSSLHHVCATLVGVFCLPSLNTVVMEPLDLGPNAGSQPRAPPQPDVGTPQEKDDVYGVGDRFSLGELSTGSGRADSHGSSEVI